MPVGNKYNSRHDVEGDDVPGDVGGFVVCDAEAQGDGADDARSRIENSQ